MFPYEKTHRYLKNHYQFFDNLKTKDCKIRENCNLLIKVKCHELRWSSRFKTFISEFSYFQVWVTDQNLKPLEIEDKIYLHFI